MPSSATDQPPSPSEPLIVPPTKPQPAPATRDFLLRLEAYLARRDGVDKLLKISRYSAKLALTSRTLTLAAPSLHPRLRSFESSVGLSRKAFRLGKFVQDLNALRSLPPSHTSSFPSFPLLLAFLAYAGEGTYYFLEQLVWLAKAGLLLNCYLKPLQRLSAWAELLGYVGSIATKLGDERTLRERLEEVGDGVEEESWKLRDKLLMKRLSIVQDLADAAMALADVRDGKGPLTGPRLMASAGLLSAFISAHKNWRSC